MRNSTFQLLPMPMGNHKLQRIFEIDPAPPHALMKNKSHYSIVFNMFGIKQEGIGIHVNFKKREVAVFARKERGKFKKGFFWVFAVPKDADLDKMTTQYKGGALEIRIPKHDFAIYDEAVLPLTMGI